MKRPSEDLAVLARRGKLSPEERRRLDMLVAASPAERWLYRLGCDYDQMKSDAPGDERLLARAVERAAGPLPPRVERRSRSALLAVLAAGCFASAGAAAVGLSQWTAAPPVPAGEGACRGEPRPACVDAPAPRIKPAVSEPASSEPVPVERESLPKDDRAPPAAVRATSSRVTKSVAAAVPPSAAGVPATAASPRSAAEQFRSANALRKAGRMPDAIAAYRQLQRAHPGSDEALLSYVLLGRILLARGEAAAAAHQFAAYLRASPGGSLAEEALRGQARALRDTGRFAEERRVHEQLLARFPKSVHAPGARARVQELD